MQRTALRLALAVTVALPLAARPSAQEGPWVVGQPLPELSLPTIDGKDTLDLGSLRGTRLLLIEFASW